MTPRPAIDASALFATRDLLRQANRKCTALDVVTSVPKSDASATKSRPDFARIVTQSLYRVGDKFVGHKTENNIRVSFLELFDSAGMIEQGRLVWHIRRLIRGEYLTSASLTLARYECEKIGPVYKLFRNGHELHTEAYTHNLEGRMVRMAKAALSHGWRVYDTQRRYPTKDMTRAQWSRYDRSLELTIEELRESGAIACASYEAPEPEASPVDSGQLMLPGMQ